MSSAVNEERQAERTAEIRKIVADTSYYIDLYFHDKDCDESMNLYDMRFIKLVINSSIINSVHLIYECLGIEYAGKRLRRRQAVDKVLDMFHHCAMRGIPKSFAAGIILMDYIVCKGIDILDDD